MFEPRIKHEHLCINRLLQKQDINQRRTPSNAPNYKDRKTKYQSLGISIPLQYWDLNKNQPKRNCPNRDAIFRLITEKTKQYQEQLLELKIENKEFTATTLVEKLTNPTKLKTVGELFAEQIERYKTAKRTGYALSIQQVYNSILNRTGVLQFIIYINQISFNDSHIRNVIFDFSTIIKTTKKYL